VDEEGSVFSLREASGAGGCSLVEALLLAVRVEDAKEAGREVEPRPREADAPPREGLEGVIGCDGTVDTRAAFRLSTDVLIEVGEDGSVTPLVGSCLAARFGVTFRPVRVTGGGGAATGPNRSSTGTSSSARESARSPLTCPNPGRKYIPSEISFNAQSLRGSKAL
jgi:hypothetical protein